MRHNQLCGVDGAARDVIEAPKLEPWIVRYELSDFEWATIKPFLPNKSRGVRRVNDRRVLNGIFWVLRSGAPWRDLPVCYGPRTTCYNRFVRWRKAGVWDRIMDSLAAAHDAAVQMIDTSIVRVHQHAACIARNRSQSMGRSRGGLTSKIHAVVDTNGLPVRLGLTAGEAHDNRLALSLLSRLRSGSMLLADRGYDADWIRAFATERGAWANVPIARAFSQWRSGLRLAITTSCIILLRLALPLCAGGCRLRSQCAFPSRADGPQACLGVRLKVNHQIASADTN